MPIVYLPAEGYAHFLNWDGGIASTTSFFKPRRQTVKLLVTNDLDDFYDDACENCPHLMDNLDDDSNVTPCRGDVEVLTAGRCLTNELSNWYSETEMDVNLLHHIFHAGDLDAGIQNGWLFVYDHERLATKGELKTISYRVGNVYGGGRICWGGVDPDLDCPRTAYTQFWANAFNSDLSPGSIERWMQKCNLSELQYQYEERWEDKFSQLIKEPFFSINDINCLAFYYSTDPAILGRFKKLSAFKPNRLNIAYGWVYKAGNQYLLRIEDSLYQFSRELANREEYPVGKKLRERKPKRSAELANAS